MSDEILPSTSPALPSLQVAGWEPPRDGPSPRVQMDFETSRPSRTYIFDSVSGTRKLSTYITVKADETATPDTTTVDIAQNDVSVVNPSDPQPSAHSASPKRPGRPSRSDSDSSDIPLPGAGRKGQPNHVPRPMNKWILFRQDYVRNRLSSGGKTRAQLKRELTDKWNNRTAEEDAYWSSLAAQIKRNLLEVVPTYAYHPNPRGSGRGRGGRASGPHRPSRRRSLAPPNTRHDDVTPPGGGVQAVVDLRASAPSEPSEPSISPAHTIPQKPYPRATSRRSKRRSASVPDAWLSTLSRLDEEPKLPQEIPVSIPDSSFPHPSPAFLRREQPSFISPQDYINQCNMAVPPVATIAQNYSCGSVGTHPHPNYPYQSSHHQHFQPIPAVRPSTDSSLAGALGNDPRALPRILTAVQPTYMTQRQDGIPQSAPAYESSALHDYHLGMNNRCDYTFDFVPQSVTEPTPHQRSGIYQDFTLSSTPDLLWPPESHLMDDRSWQYEDAIGWLDDPPISL